MGTGVEPSEGGSNLRHFTATGVIEPFEDVVVLEFDRPFLPVAVARAAKVTGDGADPPQQHVESALQLGANAFLVGHVDVSATMDIKNDAGRRGGTSRPFRGVSGNDAAPPVGDSR